MAHAFLPAALQAPSRIVTWQLPLMAVFGLLVTLGWGVRPGVSFVLGELSGWLPAWWLVRAVFSSFRAPGAFLGRFFAAEMFRLVLTGLLFVFTVLYLPVDLKPALAGLVSAVLAFWAASLLCMGKPS